MNFLRKIYYLITGTDSSSFLRSNNNDHDTKFQDRQLKKISEIDHQLIPTYPRFTIFEEVENSVEELIFDSSDFYVINNALEIFDLWNGQSIKIDKKVRFRNKIYYVNDIQVDFLSQFDDYSILSPLGHSNSDAFEGRKIPYNIQVIVKVSLA